MMLEEAGAQFFDFCDQPSWTKDDNPGGILSLARAMSAKQAESGRAICDWRVGVCIVDNTAPDIRACHINDPFTAHPGVEDNDLNMICLSGQVVGHALAWGLPRPFLTARFSDERQEDRGSKNIAAPGSNTHHMIVAGSNKTDGAIHNENDRHTSTLKLHLIRHGETAWSISGQYTGITDIPLTENGRNEAKYLGAYLREIPFCQVFTSPLKRARQTCALVALSPVAEIEPDLAEWDYGDHEGQFPEDILREQPGWTIFKDGAPNGESPDQLAARVDRLIARLRSLSGNIALFTHGHFGRVLAARWIGLSVAQSRPFLLSTASHGILSFEHGQCDAPAIEQWNAVPPPVHSSPCAAYCERALLQEMVLEQWENEGGSIGPQMRVRTHSNHGHLR